MNSQTQIDSELDQAEQSRLRGNEGRARVCARRAAGLAAREYLGRRGKLVRSPSAYDLLKLIAEDPEVDAAVRQAASLLTLPVDENFKLPVDVDLISEARNLCEVLLKNQ